MITELKSVRDVWKKMPTERHARIFLEHAIWAGDRFCPHCGSLRSTRLRGDTVRPGLYQCAERECRRQFTVTTKTPLHATKLDLRIWIAAMFLVLTSSKGISSVVMARILGVNQKTAWKLGHAIRQPIGRLRPAWNSSARIRLPPQPESIRQRFLPARSVRANRLTSIVPEQSPMSCVITSERPQLREPVVLRASVWLAEWAPE